MLSIESIERGYAGFDLGPVDLIVEDEVVAVLGPSGCGKTTLLSIVAGLVEPSAGRVELHGAEITGLPPERRGTALLFQDGALFPHLTARENIAYAAPSPDRVDGIAERLEITDVLARRPAALSGGQRSRVALARAIAADPDALLLDEPLGSLDTPVARRLRRVMREVLRDLDAPAIYVTHDQQEAAAVGDRVAVMHDGRFEQVDEPAAVFERPATPFVADFTGTRNRLPARVRGDELAWGDRCLPAPAGHGFDDGEPVWLCVRPEQIALGDGVTAIPGTVTARTYEGTGHALEIRPEDSDHPVAVWLPSSRSSAVPRVGDGASIRIPAEAVHLLPR